MAKLPTGTVTLPFTDIEGSTRLLHTLGDYYRDALEKHRALLRVAFDSTTVLRSIPRETQRALASHNFGPGVELRVRMGIHTVEPTVTEEGYFGSDVHLGARISAAAWGGQVVVSSATAALVGGERSGPGPT